MSGISETETIIKKILPYLQRLGYSIDDDIVFEDPILIGATERHGFIDILIKCTKSKPDFLIEAKRDGVKIADIHRNQALDYATSVGCLFCVVTNGKVFEIINTNTRQIITLNGKKDKLPRKVDIAEVKKQLKKNPYVDNLELLGDKKIPYREGLSLSKMNQLIQSCHNIIRRIEKNEENAFADFSKFLFLKLLEEKWDLENLQPPYSYTFHTLAEMKESEADKVKDAIISMLNKISTVKDYGEVIKSEINLKQNITYLKIVKILSTVSFSDCALDSKGAAFEYFVRATLKGKKLGQYFTPRPLVKLMLSLAESEQITASLLYGKPYKVLDPACGTGGFLVMGLNKVISDANEIYRKGKITKEQYDELVEQTKKEVFFGVDANEGVASSAKMNMIIAGDGHSNIQCNDSLKIDKLIPNYVYKQEIIDNGLADMILSNPPFGTVEGESLGRIISDYEVKSTKGQHLFIQKMISSVKPNGKIVTVIDEGVLNTESYQLLRKHILKTCRIDMILALPEETFKPNKINVKSSVLVLSKREQRDENLMDNYIIPCVKIKSLGYDGAGENLRDFDENKLIYEVSNLKGIDSEHKDVQAHTNFEFFTLNSCDIIEDRTQRFDIKYWNPRILNQMNIRHFKTIKDINIIETSRGKSPKATDYVSKKDGYALVAKAGSNISKNGLFVATGDYLDETTFLENNNKYVRLKENDILIASTGEGTLGKCCVFKKVKDDTNKEIPVIADGHITIIRVNKKEYYPEFVCDYLRLGIGSKQIERLYTGSTGLIELTPADIDTIVIPEGIDIDTQKRISNQLRKGERKLEEQLKKLAEEKINIEEAFNDCIQQLVLN